MTATRESTVHGRGNHRLDSVLELVTFTARPMPLVTLLDEAPRRIATIFGAEVCSLYLLEGDGHELVMRGNVGFPHGVVGQVRLAVGHGMTGEAVEYLRPVSSMHASEHASYKHFAELGEDRYPVFLSVPVRGRAGALGALVVQRAKIAFDSHDVELLAVLGALIAAGIRHAELIDARRERSGTLNNRRAGGGTRKVTLPGTPLVPGRALGAIAALRRPPQRPSERISLKPNGDSDVRRMRGAFDVAEKAVSGLSRRASKIGLGKEAMFLSTYTEIIGDSRFRERAAELVMEGQTIAQALGRVARDVARTAASFTRDPFLEERARDVEDLCDALSMLAAADRRAELPSKALLVGDGIGMFDLLVTARSHPVGIALTERATGPRTRALLSLFGVPAIVGVQGLFRWASDGEVALLDADHGLLVINPTKGEMAALREYKRSRGEAVPADPVRSDEG
jgi:phosphotransferase system enzyme I (PtsP)